MWPSPSKIPINTCWISCGILIKARSLGDKRTIPLVERALNNTALGLNNNTELRPNEFEYC